MLSQMHVGMSVMREHHLSLRDTRQDVRARDVRAHARRTRDLQPEPPPAVCT